MVERSDSQFGRASKRRGDVERTLTGQGAKTVAEACSVVKRGHRLLEASQQFSSDGRRLGLTRQRYAGTWRPA